MDHDRLLIGLITLSSLARIRLSLGLILPDTNIGLPFIFSILDLDQILRNILRHNVIISLARVMQRIKDKGFAFTSFLR